MDAWRAEIRIRPISPPTDYEFWLECGDTPLSSIAFGAVPSEEFPWNGTFDFGGCTTPISVGGQLAFDCTSANGIGATVAETSYVYEPQESDDVPVPNVREASFYFQIDGVGGPQSNLLCEPGDPEVFIGSFFVDQPLGDLHAVASPYSFARRKASSADMTFSSPSWT